MAEGYWVIRTYRAGKVGEKIKYWIPGKRPGKSERRVKSDVKQQQRNEANAVKRLARVLNANCAEGYVLLTLSYNEQGMGRISGGVNRSAEDYANQLYHAAHRHVRLWRDRVSKTCKARGVLLRYVIVTSDMDGKTGEYVRLHHHVIINHEALDIALGKWTMGGTHCELLTREPDRTELAAYLLNQVRRLPDEKKYISSRGLEIPEPRDRIAVSEAELKVPRGGQLLHRAEYRPGQPQYIRYILPEVGRIKKNTKQKSGRGDAGGVLQCRTS